MAVFLMKPFSDYQSTCIAAYLTKQCFSGYGHTGPATDRRANIAPGFLSCISPAHFRRCRLYSCSYAYGGNCESALAASTQPHNSTIAHAGRRLTTHLFPKMCYFLLSSECEMMLSVCLGIEYES